METTTVLVGESSTGSSGPGPERDAIRFGEKLALRVYGVLW